MEYYRQLIIFIKSYLLNKVCLDAGGNEETRLRLVVFLFLFIAKLLIISRLNNVSINASYFIDRVFFSAHTFIAHMIKFHATGNLLFFIQSYLLNKVCL